MKAKGDIIILLLSIPLALLTALASFAGAFNGGTYEKEAIGYAAQAIGQDVVNLFVVVPILISSSIFSYCRNKVGFFIWSGSLFYLAYSYAIYSFALHFNNLFVVYCLILGLSFFSLLYFFITMAHEKALEWFTHNVLKKTVAAFLLIISGLFYCLWLSEIIPAIVAQQAPASVTENGLLTNPVHVLDLAICLPGLALTGIFLLKGKRIGFVLAPAMLSFCILLAVAILAMVLVMKLKGMEADLLLTVIFGAIAVSGIFLLVKYLRKLK